MRTATLLLLTLLALAGCLETRYTLHEGPAPLTGPSPDDQTGTMTATEAAPVDRTGRDGPRFYHERTHKISGTETLNAMLVALTTFNGPIELTTTSGDAYEVTLILRGTGESPQEAKARLDAIRLEWSHESGDLHFLRATLTPATGDSSGQTAAIRARFPADTRYTADLRTSNGPIAIRALTGDALQAYTSNGPIDAQAEAPTVSLRTSNGPIDAHLVAAHADLLTSNGPITLTHAPTASGSVTLTTSNAPIEATLHEAPTVGYDVTVTTSNGKAYAELDGKAQESKPLGGTVTHRTTNYDSRAIQVRVAATTSNSPAAVEGR